MLEFALLTPVIAALLTGAVGVSMTFVRTLQADQLCRKALDMAGTDLDDPATRRQLLDQYGGNALENRSAVLYLTHIVRDPSGYHADKSYSIGRLNRWTSAAQNPETIVSLEPGEDAWFAEMWMDNDTIFSSISPSEIHSRIVR